MKRFLCILLTLGLLLAGLLPAAAEEEPEVEFSEEEMEEFCKGLPRYKRPRKYIFAEVPRNSTGKIDKPELRKRYGAAGLVATETSH